MQKKGPSGLSKVCEWTRKTSQDAGDITWPDLLQWSWSVGTELCYGIWYHHLCHIDNNRVSHRLSLRESLMVQVRAMWTRLKEGIVRVKANKNRTLKRYENLKRYINASITPPNKVNILGWNLITLMEDPLTCRASIMFIVTNNTFGCTTRKHF